MTAKRGMVVAIDGPAGAGKSTVADGVARRLGLARLDTGSMYRALTWAALERSVDLDDAEALQKLASSLEFRPSPEGIFVDGVLREQQIRDPAVSAVVSMVSRHPEVRAVMVAAQRRLADAGGVVIEGRDIGSIVAPGAPVKIFLTAAPEERARRRREELAGAGHDLSHDRLMAEMEARDARDDATTPLRPADGAVVIDSTGKTADDVADEIAAIARSVQEKA
ncbi:MAG: (d)CMP kinase [Actinomycetota bacterium]